MLRVQRRVSGRVRRWTLAGSLAGLGALAACTTRPVAELSPQTSNIFVELVANSAVNKIDLLFMIDNSRSMADKQATLSQAVPALVRRLVTPPCIGEGGVPLDIDADADGRCAQGRPEFRPIRDIHIGVITSSLGPHGGEHCAAGDDAPDAEDNGRLLGTLQRGSGLATGGLGFLKWAPDGGGESDPDVLIEKFTNLVTRVGENGCGYEASLEAWYRFLIDPEPPLTVIGGGDWGTSTVSGVDTALLEQRAEFLRPDSLVAIVMLTDENDCSVRDETGFIGHWVTRRARASRSTSSCETDPNSPCCRSCALTEAQVPGGCVPVAEDPSCKDPYHADEISDATNLRCFDQTRRFGIDLLWPTSRYVRGLTEPRIPDSRGELVQNPLFQAPPGVLPRSPRQVFLAGIVGVPWQDIATPASLADPALLAYLPYAELSAEERWDLIVGAPSAHVPPRDAFMVESVAERDGTNPILNVRTSPSSSLDPRANPINGHEADYTAEPSDLQYACTYPLLQPRDCLTDPSWCDCEEGDQRFKRPLCQAPGSGTIGTTQYYAKAYPGLRPLEVLKDFGSRTTNAIVGSICPKISDPAARASYGYNPAMHALVDRLKEGFRGACMSRELNLRPDGSLPCTVVETQPVALDQRCGSDDTPPAGCDGARGRRPASRQLARAVREELAKVGSCGTEGRPPCSDFCMCQILPVSGPGLADCQNDPDDDRVQSSEAAFGYCYVDPHAPPRGQGIGALEVVAPPRCDETEPRRLRFMGQDTPAKNTLTLMACAGESG